MGNRLSICPKSLEHVILTPCYAHSTWYYVRPTWSASMGRQEYSYGTSFPRKEKSPPVGWRTNPTGRETSAWVQSVNAAIKYDINPTHHACAKRIGSMHWAGAGSNRRHTDFQNVLLLFVVSITEPLFVSVSVKRAYVSRLKRLYHYKSSSIIVKRANHVLRS